MAGEDLQLETRRRIYAFIEKQPGTHLRTISRDLGMAMGTLRYHLDFMEKHEYVATRREQNLKIYFVAGQLSSAEKRIVGFLRQQRFRNVICDIIANPGTSQAGVASRLEMKTSTLSKYTRILEDRGILVSEKKGREKRYTAFDAHQVVGLLLAYRKSFWDRLVDNVLQVYFER